MNLCLMRKKQKNETRSDKVENSLDKVSPYVSYWAVRVELKESHTNQFK